MYFFIFFTKYRYCDEITEVKIRETCVTDEEIGKGKKNCGPQPEERTS